MFTGAMTALVTPMRGGAVDHKALEALVEAQIAGGVDGLIPCGTTGEVAMLSDAEHADVIRTTVAAAKKRVPVIAGTGTSSTHKTIQASRAAKEAGADGILVITPYYVRPTQEGLYQHFRAVAEAVPLPMVVYNVPARTGCDLLPETLVRLAEVASIVGIKEASGLVTRTQQILGRLGDRLVVLSGEDAINYPLYAVGARGCISVTSNVAPALISGAWDAVVAGDHARARALHAQSLPLTEALFLEASPTPAKTALGMMGRLEPELRLPLVAMSPAGREKLRTVLAQLSLV